MEIALVMLGTCLVEWLIEKSPWKANSTFTLVKNVAVGIGKKALGK